jgi:hypothetical protein
MNVSEVLAAFVIRAIISELLPDYMAQQPRKQPSSKFMYVRLSDKVNCG